MLPCFNEEASILPYLTALQRMLTKHSLDAELIIVDNNSSDASASLLTTAAHTDARIRIVHETKQGYGFAYLRGFSEARGTVFVMVDLDQSYDPSDIPLLLDALTNDVDMVIGNRFSGAMRQHAMPILHRYVGNPILSLMMRVFFQTHVRDAHCGLRVLTRRAYEQMTLATGGMEFASEMIIKATRAGLRIQEVPVSYHPRTGISKLRTFRDGWRHLRFMLLYSPLYLFLVPGIIAFIVGTLTMLLLYTNALTLFGIQFVVHPMFAAALLMIVGYQLITFAGFAKTYAVTHLGERSSFLERIFRNVSIDHAVGIGAIGILIGTIVYCIILYRWIASDFGSLDEIKNAVLGLTLIVLGIQTISAAFMTSILGIRER